MLFFKKYDSYLLLNQPISRAFSLLTNKLYADPAIISAVKAASPAILKAILRPLCRTAVKVL